MAFIFSKKFWEQVFDIRETKIILKIQTRFFSKVHQIGATKKIIKIAIKKQGRQQISCWKIEAVDEATSKRNTCSQTFAKGTVIEEKQKNLHLTYPSPQIIEEMRLVQKIYLVIFSKIYCQKIGTLFDSNISRWTSNVGSQTKFKVTTLINP